MACDHDIAERETAVADGMCPVCLAHRLSLCRATLEKISTMVHARCSYEMREVAKDALREISQ